MDINQFKAIGEDLFGHAWQTRMAKSLGIDPSTVRRWVGGAVPVPPAIVAYLKMLSDRQETRGSLIFEKQNIETPVPIEEELPSNIERMRKKLLFPGIDQERPMPSVYATQRSEGIIWSLSDDAADKISTNCLSYVLTRHPDSYQLKGYTDAAKDIGHSVISVKNRYHHYSVIAFETSKVTRFTHQIVTHAGAIRTIISPIGSVDEGAIKRLEYLPGFNA